MDSIQKRVSSHYSSGKILETIEKGLSRDGEEFSLEELGRIDRLHTRGKEASTELANLGEISQSDFVLDVGCGLGGTARQLANDYGCKVLGIDLTEEHVLVGNELSRRVGLGSRVELECGDALDLPFADETFDIVWTEHAQMNIANKVGFYGEIARVLKPAGKFLFHDVFSGNGERLDFPVPWANDFETSFLFSSDEARSTLNALGLSVDHWLPRTEVAISFFQNVRERSGDESESPSSSVSLMKGSPKEKVVNYLANLMAGRLEVVMCVAQKVR